MATKSSKKTKVAKAFGKKKGISKKAAQKFAKRAVARY
jgi:hypothetical protein